MKNISVRSSAGRLIGTAVALILACVSAPHLYGATVTRLDEASVRSAMADGSVIFAADGTVTLSAPLVITQQVKFDASGHQVTLSGSNSTRLFFVQPGATLDLQNLTLADGFVIGTNGGPSMDGGPGQGGAIYSRDAVSARNCLFLHNGAVGGRGGAATSNDSNGNGGLGCGGAIFAAGGSVGMTNCVFAGNYSLGGTGAAFSPTTTFLISDGGPARGGAIYNDGATVQFVQCTFSTNAAYGGPGTRYGIPGASLGGIASGGAVYINDGTTRFLGSTISGNNARAEATRSSYGGGIYQNAGDCHLIDTWVTANSVFGGHTLYSFGSSWSGASGCGGGIYVGTGALWLSNSTFSGNLAIGAPAGTYNTGPGFGGGVFNSGSVCAMNTTIHGNTAQAGPTANQALLNPGNGFGGGVYNSGTLTLDYSTVAGNAATPTPGGDPAASQGGGIYTTNGTTTLHCTLLANNLSGSNNFGALLDSGYNLASDLSCHFTTEGSRNDTKAQLGPLDFYGGPTPTLPLLTGSPAIDSGDPAQCLPTDQRGRLRPFGLAPDIGAFESSPPYVIRGTVWGVTLHRDVSVTADPGHTIATLGGTYSFEGVNPGPYVVSPADPDYVFVPASRAVTIGPDQVGLNFKAYRINALSLDDVANGSLHLVYAGTNGQTYRVLSSPNLLEWQPVATNTLDASRYFEFFAPVTNGAARFFRIQQEP